MPLKYLGEIGVNRHLVDNLKLSLANMVLRLSDKDLSTNNFQFHLKIARDKHEKFRDSGEITPFIQPTWLERLDEFDKYFL
ncbi:unnamed protein product, partial [marine sediment metagenome]